MNDVNFTSGQSRQPKLLYSLNLIQDRRKLPLITRHRLNKISDESLSKAYAELVKDLMKDELYKQMCVTDCERTFKSTLMEYSRLEVWTTCWIGNMNFDLFIPGIRYGKYQGLAIEVNGSFHNKPVQMLKDEYRAFVLNEMGIYIISVDNRNVKNGSVRKVIEDIINWERLDSRSKKRLKRKVRLKTIIDHRKRIIANNLTLSKTVLDAFGAHIPSLAQEDV